MIVQKAKETMSARERTLRTFARERTDRVTIGYDANPGIHRRLSDALGIADGDMERVRQALGVDYRGVDAPYIGPALFAEFPGRRTNPVDGFRMRWIEHGSGGYWDFCDFPLAGADADAIAGFPVPDPDCFDYKAAGEQIAAHREYAIHIGGAGTADVLNSTGRIMGMEDTLVNLMTEDEATLTFVNRRMDMQLGVLERILERNRGSVDFLWMGEDLGTQRAPMISLDMYRRVLRPIHQRFVDLGKAYGLYVMVHTCGSSSWAYEDFIEMGVDAVDTLQPEAVDMSPEYLKKRFGGRLSFRGCVSTAEPLTHGSPGDVVRNVRETLAVMMDGYGYHFAPTHAIQDNTPAENVVAMYQAAHDLGIYRG